MTWDSFKKDFFNRFFPREQREATVDEFINLPQGAMSVKEYSLRLTKLYKYASSLVCSARDEMSCYITCVYLRA